MDSSSSFPPATAPSGVGQRRPSVTTSPADPQTGLTTGATPSLTTPYTDMDASDDLQRRISRGSAAACLEAGNRLVADLLPERPITTPLQWSRAAMFFITGIIWDTFLPHSTYCPELSSDGLDNVTCDHHDPSSLDSSDLSPLARSLIVNLISLLQQSPLRRYEFTLPDLPNITSRTHCTALMDVLHALGRTDENPHVSIATLSYRLANEFLLADELLPSLGVSGVKSGEPKGPAQATDRALLGELSSAASLTHRTKSDCSSSMTADDDSVSAGSSYPATPLTQSRREIDLDESPATTPSQKSSTEDLTKVFVTHPTSFRNLLQEHLSHKLDTSLTQRRTHTRSSSYSIASPASVRSSSSIRSTASSIFARMCGTPKAKSTVSIFAEPTSTMGSFTPVPITTAAGSLRRYGPTEENRRSKTRAGLPSRSHTQPEAGPSRLTSPPKLVQRPGHARSSTISVVPSISLTHSSFRPESVLESNFSRRRSSSYLSTPAEKPFAMAPALLERHMMGGTTRPKPKPPISRTQSAPFPPLDATLAALEKSCRLRNQVTCACCSKIGWDFPKNRDGQALCSRECRVALKARNNTALPSGHSMICA